MSRSLSTSEKLPLPLSKPSLSHLAPLDGLRGLAVLLVMMDHLSWNLTSRLPLIKRYCEAGWIGVDLFFVLSGFLITRGLAKENNLPQSSRLKMFWMRRVLRIFPLYYIVTLLGTLIAYFFKASEQIPDLSFWIYLQNYSLALRGGDFLWMAHFWSLAIEEQFYFFWPFLVLYLPKNIRASYTIAFVALCVLLRSLFVFKPELILSHLSPEKAALAWVPVGQILYRSTPTRVDGLLLGALIAFLHENPHFKLSLLWIKIRPLLLVVTGALLFLLTLWTRGLTADDRRVVLLGYLMCGIFFSTVVSTAAHGKLPAVLSRIFSTGPLSLCGKVSYGMYLFHWPMVFLSAPFFLPWVESKPLFSSVLWSLAFTCFALFLTYFLSVLSFKFIESPFLKQKEKFHE